MVLIMLISTISKTDVGQETMKKKKKKRKSKRNCDLRERSKVLGTGLKKPLAQLMENNGSWEGKARKCVRVENVHNVNTNLTLRTYVFVWV